MPQGGNRGETGTNEEHVVCTHTIVRIFFRQILMENSPLQGDTDMQRHITHTHIVWRPGEKKWAGPAEGQKGSTTHPYAKPEGRKTREWCLYQYIMNSLCGRQTDKAAWFRVNSFHPNPLIHSRVPAAVRDWFFLLLVEAECKCRFEKKVVI